jgi:hypothetical protein
VDRHITAEWAWISKEPGSREDYGILACSAGHADTGGLAAAYVTGVPSSSLPADAPVAAPWVAFGPHLAPTGRLTLSIAIQDPWENQDQAGRPIWPRRLFVCHYDEVAASRPSYQALWESVTHQKLPRADRHPVPLTISPDLPGRVLSVIGHIGLDRVAAITTTLLDRHVAVTGTEHLRLSDASAPVDRLGVLDAIVALLPFGFRAGLSASSAVDNTVAHRIRLTLASYANDAQQAVDLRGDAVAPRSDVARDYLALLLDRERREGLPTIIAYLRDATAACGFDHPEDALRILAKLNRPRRGKGTVKAGAESTEAVRGRADGDTSQTGSMRRNPELAGHASEKTLRTAAEQVIVTPEALSRHADERSGVTASPLALAMYRARRAGMPVTRISEVLAQAKVKDATLAQKIGHRELDEVLREFAALVAYGQDDATGEPGTADDWQSRACGVLAESWELVCRGALGVNYGAEFWRYLDTRLRDEAKAARQARRRLRRSVRVPWRLVR